MPLLENRTAKQYYAHSANTYGAWHRRADHLAGVSKRAREFLQEGKGAGKGK